MDDISLHKFLLSVPSVMSIIFPREAERHIAGAELKSLMTYDGLEDSNENERASGFFTRYIDELESRTEGELIDF